MILIEECVMTQKQPHDAGPTDHLARYVRQIRYPPIGEAGQQRLVESRVLICGCGALGSVLANTLARAGVGHLRIVDRDFLELNNLQRQVLYTEADVEATVPKAIAAREKLLQINSEIDVEAIVADLSSNNVLPLVSSVDLILDGTDNFETRFLLNDVAVREGLPWIYGGCIGAEGQTITIIPGETPCLRCLIPEPPPPGTSPTCDTAGILGPVVNVVASIQACEALKILSGNHTAICRSWTIFDLWENQMRQVTLDSLNTEQCATCSGKEYPWLEGRRGGHTAVLCGRNAVQISFPDQAAISLESLAEKLAGIGKVSTNPFLLRLQVDTYQVTVFPDGRAIVTGTEDITEARTVYAKYIGG